MFHQVLARLKDTFHSTCFKICVLVCQVSKLLLILKIHNHQHDPCLGDLYQKKIPVKNISDFYLPSSCISYRLITHHELIQRHLMKTSSVLPPKNALLRGERPPIVLFFLPMLPYAYGPAATEGAILTLQDLRETKFLLPSIKRFEHICLIRNTTNAGRKETQTQVMKLKRTQGGKLLPPFAGSLQYTMLHSTCKQRANLELLRAFSPV